MPPPSKKIRRNLSMNITSVESQTVVNPNQDTTNDDEDSSKAVSGERTRRKIRSISTKIRRDLSNEQADEGSSTFYKQLYENSVRQYNAIKTDFESFKVSAKLDAKNKAAEHKKILKEQVVEQKKILRQEIAEHKKILKRTDAVYKKILKQKTAEHEQFKAYEKTMKAKQTNLENEIRTLKKSVQSDNAARSLEQIRTEKRIDSLLNKLNKKQELESKQLTELNNCCKSSYESGITAMKDVITIIFESDLQCSICSEFFVKAITTQCKHTFCTHCLKTWVSSERSVCPICRSKIQLVMKPLAIDSVINQYYEKIMPDDKEKRNELLNEKHADIQFSDFNVRSYID